jgi:acetyl-CoA/propionyl-CoA/long-chain acyl-CoA carboxylase, biotin carboxylase, biotin carboxyl carrier protein
VKVIGPPYGGAVNGAAPAAASPKPRRAERAAGSSGGGADELVSPLQGNMWKVLVEQGQEVQEGQLVCIIEAMKMENEITAHKGGVIERLAVKEGEPIASGATIAVIKAAAV